MQLTTKVQFFLIFLLVLFAAGCKGAKTTKTEVAYLPAKEIIEKHYSFDEPIKLKADLTVKYQNNEDLISLNASMRLVKDSAIWISISKLGFPVGKLLVSKDSVKFYEKINESYFEGDFGLISQWLGADFDFDKFQNLWFGDALFDLRESKYDVSLAEKNYLLVAKKKNPIFDALFWINPINFKIDQERLVLEDQKKLEILYENYQVLEKGFFPESFEIQTGTQNKKTTINVNYKSVEKVEKLNFPFKIPKDYKQIKLR